MGLSKTSSLGLSDDVIKMECYSNANIENFDIFRSPLKIFEIYFNEIFKKTSFPF